MAKYNKRPYPLFSACGLNCGLCPNYHAAGKSRCSGCGGDAFFNPSCGVLSCLKRHGDLEYCYLCAEYPCQRYDGAGLFDSFITHRNQLKDMEKAQAIGMDAYRVELDAKVERLCILLEHYNDGRKKNLFCLSVNLLSLQDIDDVMEQIEKETTPNQTQKEKAAIAARLFQSKAEEQNITLKLNKKSR